MSFCFDGGSVSSFDVNSSDLSRSGGRFRRPLPNNMPVSSQSSGSTGADDVKHKLSAVCGQHAVKRTGEGNVKNLRVLLGSANPRSITLEVTENGSRVVPEIAEVHSFSTLPQQQ